MTLPISVADEVREAVAAHRPVVALESTIFTHGLPRPVNLEAALEAEDQLRRRGAVPATVGVVQGRAVVGLRPEEIATLSRDDSAVKVSLRDIPIAAAKGLSGGTTVAATAFLADRAGVRVFATGGLGGVHHGASSTFDESADLPVLARTPILVVAAGVKSILDIAASLERMETLSITVVGFGTTSFPGFYLADSGHTLDYDVDARQAAELIRCRDALDSRGAIVVANPVAEGDQLPRDEHDRVLASAWEAAAAADVIGHDATPFLLEYIQRATGGRSLTVNLAVYRNNIDVAAQISRAFSTATSPLTASR